MTTRGERLRQAREKIYPSARQAAQALGVPVATYTSHERAQQPGGRDYSPEDAQKYARRFGVPSEQLLIGTRAVGTTAALKSPRHNTDPVTCRLIGYVGASDLVHFFADEEVEPVPAIEHAVDATVALEIRNGSDFDGWLAFFDDLKRPLTANLIGQTCVVALDDEGVFLRRVEKSRHNRALVHLVSSNSRPIMGVRPTWAARVHIMRQR